MKAILPILSIASKVVLGLVLVSALVLNVGMAYIMFAPDTFPKPFYLLYRDETGAIQVGPQGSTALVEGENVEAGEHEVEAEPTAEPAVPGTGVMLNTGTKIINLADTTQKRYIRVTIVFEFAQPVVNAEAEEAAGHGGEEGADPLAAYTEELNALMPIIDDQIITLISTKKFEDLYTAEGKEAIRSELMTRVAERLTEHQVISVYFTEFVVE